MTLIGIEKKRLKKHRILKVVFFIVICLIALILVGSNVQGLSEFEQIEWYKNNSGLLTIIILWQQVLERLAGVLQSF